MSEPAIQPSQPTDTRQTLATAVDRGDGTAFLKLPKPRPIPCPPVGEQSGNLRHTSRRPSVPMLPTCSHPLASLAPSLALLYCASCA